MPMQMTKSLFLPTWYVKLLNTTIFISQEEDLTEEKRKLLQTFPEKDRGIMGNWEDAPGLIKVVDDPLEAAALKSKLQQQKMREAKREREASKQDGYISKSVRFVETTVDGTEEHDMDEYYDSDELVYDSEEEAEEERIYQEKQTQFMMNGKTAEVQQPEEGYDANVELKKVQRYRPAPGVKFAEFDEFGMSKAEGLGQYISTDNGIPDFFIEAPPEMLEKSKLRPRGVFRDYDKQLEDLTYEGKYLFASSFIRPYHEFINLTYFFYRKGRFQCSYRL